MKNKTKLLSFCTIILFLLCSFYQNEISAAEEVKVEKKLDMTLFSLLAPSDPIEGYNRVIFEGNDFLMLWVFDPLTKVYSFIIPRTGRERVDNVIVNLEFVIRILSCLLEAEFKGAAIEAERFIINVTLGVAGIFDVADHWFGLKAYNEDFGQAFASWGIGDGCYFVLPIMGPSTLRDALGEIFFVACHPITWIPLPGLGTFVFVNRMSLRVKQYLSLRDPSLDKYDSMKNMWYLNRQIQIKNLDRLDHPYFKNIKSL